ncbi:MAG: hypothetical protein RR012_01375 [Oscillospiraceae bacterium]
MNKYQIKEVKGISNHAGSKAREDASFFAQQLGYESLIIYRTDSQDIFSKAKRYLGALLNWIRIFFKVKKNSLILLQNPFDSRQMGRESCLKLLKSIKKCKIISLIHDIEELRKALYNNNIEHEFQFMKNNSDYFIVHNERMKDYMVGIGFNTESLIVLEIFDYAFGEYEEKSKDNSTDVIFAGALSRMKSSFIYKLGEMKNKITFNLYGPAYDEEYKPDNITYNGSFPSDEVPNVIEGKFGLIWDGEKLDSCTGNWGNYLRYNNPHKTSLYIVSRVPVIVWKESAMAEFIKKENVGICVDSLEDIKGIINNLTGEEYAQMTENTNRIAKKLETGYYLKTAIKKIETLAQLTYCVKGKKYG